jgi:hypothetical protein
MRLISRKGCQIVVYLTGCWGDREIIVVTIVLADECWGTLSKYLPTRPYPYKEKIMKLRQAVSSGFGLSMVLVCAISSAQARPSKALSPSPQTITNPSSSLGGPITPTQPDFFATINSPVLPESLNQSLDGGFANQPIPSAEEKTAVPLVGDPPRQSRGGIINIKTD